MFAVRFGFNGHYFETKAMDYRDAEELRQAIVNELGVYAIVVEK